VIYPKDHNPPHVHIISPDGEAKFALKDFECIFVRGFGRSDIRRLREYLRERKDLLEEAWNDYQA